MIKDVNRPFCSRRVITVNDDGRRNKIFRRIKIYLSRQGDLYVWISSDESISIRADNRSKLIATKTPKCSLSHFLSLRPMRLLRI